MIAYLTLVSSVGASARMLQSDSPEMFVPVLCTVRLDHRSLAPEILSTLYHPTIILTGSHWKGL